MKLNFTNTRVPDDGWGVERYYIAVNRKDGAVRAPMNDDQINGRNGPLWANEFAGGQWVWAELNKEAALSLLAQPDGGANPASNAQEIETLRKQVKQGIEREMKYRERLVEIMEAADLALYAIATPKL
jgi:hypothetical protein